MAAHLVSLKLHLLRGGLRGKPWRVAGAVLAGLWVLYMLVLAVAGLVALRFLPADTAGAAVTVAGAAALLGWALLPVLAFGADATLDPRRFAPFGLTSRQLVPGLLLSGFVGLPGAATVVTALATVITWSRGVGPALVALGAAVVGALTCVAASRATTTLASGLVARRRSREIAASAGALLALVVGPLLGFVTSSSVLDDGPASLRAAGDVVGWTPVGWVWSAPYAAARGAWPEASAKLLLAVLLLLATCLLWSRALEDALVTPVSSGAARRHAPGSRLDRLPATPAWAVAGRCLRYWRRDPRYLTSIVATFALPAAVLSLSLLGMFSFRSAAVAVGPLLGGLLGWGQHNDVAYDGTAVWTHVASGLPGRADRAGRAAAVLVWAVPLTVVASVAGCGVAGRLHLLPPVVGLALGLLGVGTGVSAVSSALLPYRVPEAGANPFQTPPGATVATLVAQAVTSTATCVLAAPVVVAFVLALRGSATAGWVTLVLGGALGAGAVLGGVLLGGGLFERRAPELLAAMR